MGIVNIMRKCLKFSREPRWTLPDGLVVSVPDYEPREQGSVLGWAPISVWFFFLPF